MNSTPPPLDPEVQLRTYFAVQLNHPREPHAKAAEAVCVAAKALGLLFRRVETMDVLQIGMKPFLRMRSDLSDAKVILQRLHTDTARGIIYMLPEGCFEVQFPPNVMGGRIAPVSSTPMYMAPRGTSTMFRGPKVKSWYRAFLP